MITPNLGVSTFKVKTVNYHNMTSFVTKLDIGVTSMKCDDFTSILKKGITNIDVDILPLFDVKCDNFNNYDFVRTSDAIRPNPTRPRALNSNKISSS